MVRKEKLNKRKRINERFKYIEVKDTIPYSTYDSELERKRIFDTDSFSIGVNNRCSGCISHKGEDFVRPLKECHRVIK